MKQYVTTCRICQEEKVTTLQPSKNAILFCKSWNTIRDCEGRLLRPIEIGDALPKATEGNDERGTCSNHIRQYHSVDGSDTVQRENSIPSS